MHASLIFSYNASLWRNIVKEILADVFKISIEKLLYRRAIISGACNLGRLNQVYFGLY